jgi:hypothetical protein
MACEDVHDGLLVLEVVDDLERLPDLVRDDVIDELMRRGSASAPGAVPQVAGVARVLRLDRLSLPTDADNWLIGLSGGPIRPGDIVDQRCARSSVHGHDHAYSFVVDELVVVERQLHDRLVILEVADGLEQLPDPIRDLVVEDLAGRGSASAPGADDAVPLVAVVARVRPLDRMSSSSDAENWLIALNGGSVSRGDVVDEPRMDCRAYVWAVRGEPGGAAHTFIVDELTCVERHDSAAS